MLSLLFRLLEYLRIVLMESVRGAVSENGR
jgi:hypothetical protein